MKSEQYYLKELSPFQLEIVEILKKLGYVHKYFHTYTKTDTLNSSIDVSKLDTLEEVIIRFYGEGADQKRFEIQRALGL